MKRAVAVAVAAAATVTITAAAAVAMTIVTIMSYLESQYLCESCTWKLSTRSPEHPGRVSTFCLGRL